MPQDPKFSPRTSPSQNEITPCLRAPLLFLLRVLRALRGPITPPPETLTSTPNRHCEEA